MEINVPDIKLYLCKINGQKKKSCINGIEKYQMYDMLD